MEFPQKEEADSRASEAGRKRAFQEPSASSGEVITIDSSDDDSAVQPQQKRARHDHDDQSPSASSRDTNIPDQATDGTSVVEDNVLAPAISWNQGVQSGLRTSFGNKKKKFPVIAGDGKPKIGGVDDGKQWDETKVPSTVEALSRAQFMPKDAKVKTRKGKVGVEMNQMEAETENAAVALEKFGLPLPPHCQPIADKIAGGLTLYPKKLDPSPVYVNKAGEFRLEEAFHDGKPVSIKDLTMRDFAFAFLQGNRDKMEGIKAKQLGAAFNIYVLKYYSHVHSTFREPITAAQSLHPNKLLAVLRQTKDRFKEPKKNDTNEGATVPDTILGSNEKQMNIVEGFLETRTQYQIPKGDDEAQRDKDGIGRLQGAPPENEEKTSPSDGISPQIATFQSSLLDKCSQQTSIAVPNDEVFIVDATPAKVELPEGGYHVPSVEGSAAAGYDEAEDDILQRYFIAAGSRANPPRCLSCAGNDHSTVDCNAFDCVTCDIKGDHTTIGCPQNQRCSKCRRRGHGFSECPEKLRVPKDEMPGCDICNSADHVEADCSFIWRSFRTRPGEIRKVNNIHIYCYCCGNSGHYGGECGLHQGSVPSGFTWLRSNLATYLDPSSTNQVLAAGLDYSLTERSRNGFSVKGKGSRPKKHQPQSIIIDDSDDDKASTFIRPKINNPLPKLGNIRIADSFRPQNAGQSNPSHRVPPTTYRTREDSARYGRETTFTPPPRYGDQPNYQPRSMDMNYNLRSRQDQPAYSNGWSAQEYPQRNTNPPPPPNTIRDDGAPIRGKNYRVGKRARRRKQLEGEFMASGGR